MNKIHLIGNLTRNVDLKYTNNNIPDFQKMIKDSARREWDYVLVYKLDRFSRNKFH